MRRHSFIAGFFFCLVVSFPILLWSQNTKGFVATVQNAPPIGKTRAVVVGISHYQFLQSLNYADADAQVFADYLRSSPYWNVDPGDIALLLNEKARYGDILVRLQQAVLQSKPGDALIFYFSGHGDVETITKYNRGYLLAYDTYTNNYMSSGIKVDDLRDLFLTLLDNQVKVIVVTDACRSGKLAGGMSGMEYTAANLSTVWKNEIKILSSQPGQLSYEDRKWGKGRGVFSYYLTRGLAGEADLSRDSTITLWELQMYVTNHVSEETSNQQQPIFSGPTPTSTVIASYRRSNTATPSKAGNTASRPSRTFKIPFDSCTSYYDKMYAAIGKGNLIAPEMGSAVNYYRLFKHCRPDSSLLLTANGQLLTALINRAQDVVNQSFIGKKMVEYGTFQEGVKLFEELIRNNDLRLPQSDHWRNLQRYLQVQGEVMWGDVLDTSRLQRILDTAIRHESNAPYLLAAQGILECRKGDWDQAIPYLKDAVASGPGWLIPPYFLGICYAEKKDYEQALAYYHEVMLKDSAFGSFECGMCILNQMTEYAFKLSPKKGLMYLKMNLDISPNNLDAYDRYYRYCVSERDFAAANDFVRRLKMSDFNVSYLLMLYRFQQDFYHTPMSLKALQRAYFMAESKQQEADYFYTLGKYYQTKKRPNLDSAMICYRMAIELDSSNMPYYMDPLVDLMVLNGQTDEAISMVQANIPKFYDDYKLQLKYLLMWLYLRKGEFESALELAENLLDKDWITCKELEYPFKKYRNHPAFKVLMSRCQKR
jgi:tetratricopeptide (TPR) repeat protein